MRDYSTDILDTTEDRHREFKQSAAWVQLRWKIAKTAIAMANTRDGGLLIIGVNEAGKGFIPQGLSNEHLATFDDDTIHAFINKYADPYVKLSIHRLEIDEKQFIVIHIEEFDTLPVISKNSGEEGLKQGAVYVRSFRQPETCMVKSQNEMRELLDLAIERGVRQFVRRATGAGAGQTDLVRHSHRTFSTRTACVKSASSDLSCIDVDARSTREQISPYVWMERPSLAIRGDIFGEAYIDIPGNAPIGEPTFPASCLATGYYS